MSETPSTPSFFDFGTRQAQLFSAFMPFTATVLKNTKITEGLSGSHDQLQRTVDANLRLWHNAMTASFNSVEALGRCVTGSRDDLLDAINTGSPIEFSRRQIGAFHDRHRQLLADLRSIADDLDAAWLQVVETISLPKTGAAAESAEVVDIAEGSQTATPAPGVEVEASAQSDSESRRPQARNRQKDA